MIGLVLTPHRVLASHRIPAIGAGKNTAPPAIAGKMACVFAEKYDQSFGDHRNIKNYVSIPVSTPLSPS